MEDRIVDIAYGRGRLPLVLKHGLAEWHVLTRKIVPPFPDARRAFADACRNPIGCRPLREQIRASDRVVIVTSDATRPVPNHVLIPWLLEELGIPAEQVTIVIGTGSHRRNTPDEIAASFGEETARRVQIVNHYAYDPEEHVEVGTTRSGTRVSFHRLYVEADKRIAVGLIEPHFFAGFSGGAKAIAPGIAAVECILDLHRYDLIAHPNATWGQLDGNPVYNAVAEMAAFCPPDFLVNVTLNETRAITGFFVGDYVAAHRAGCAAVFDHAMLPVARRFPIVVTSNSGYPLDQNLYQSVKGMSAAARVTEDGGSILMASECSDGIPDHGRFAEWLREHDTVDDLDAHLRAAHVPTLDQWQAQVLVQILKRNRVNLYSTLGPETVRQCKLIPIDDLQQALDHEIQSFGKGASVALLPEGPLTIPILTR